MIDPFDLLAWYFHWSTPARSLWWALLIVVGAIVLDLIEERVLG